MKKLLVFACLAWLCHPALAQDRTFMSKADAEGLAKGKKWNHVRAGDGAKVQWDLQGNGQLFGMNQSSGSRDQGKWAINDAGQLCVTWQGRSQNRCVAVLKEGDKLKLVDSGDLKGAYADMTVE